MSGLFAFLLRLRCIASERLGSTLKVTGAETKTITDLFLPSLSFVSASRSYESSQFDFSKMSVDDCVMRILTKKVLIAKNYLNRPADFFNDIEECLETISNQIENYGNVDQSKIFSSGFVPLLVDSITSDIGQHKNQHQFLKRVKCIRILAENYREVRVILQKLDTILPLFKCNLEFLTEALVKSFNSVDFELIRYEFSRLLFSVLFQADSGTHQLIWGDSDPWSATANSGLLTVPNLLMETHFVQGVVARKHMEYDLSLVKCPLWETIIGFFLF